MFKRLHVFLFLFFAFLQTSFANLQEDIIPTSSTETVLGWTWWANILDDLLAYVRDSIFGLLAMIAIWVFLYIGFKLVIARWNPEEFKKTLNMLIYAVIGIFIVSFAFAAVRLVAGLNI